MRGAFTLIELLVVMVIMTIVMAMVIPEGSKLLKSFEKRLDTTKESQELSKQASLSFLQVKEQTLQLLGKTFSISSKGVITAHEKSDDNN